MKWILNKLGLAKKKELEEWQSYAKAIEKWVYDGREICFVGDAGHIAKYTTLDAQDVPNARILVCNNGHAIVDNLSQVVIRPGTRKAFVDTRTSKFDLSF